MSENKTVMAALAGVVAGLYVTWKAGALAAKIAQGNLNLTMAGGVASAAGFALALDQIDAARHAANVADWVEGMVAADGAVTDATKAGIYLAQVMGGLDEHISSLIDNNPRVAQTIIDNADAFGISAEQAAAYQAELDRTTAATENATDAITRQKNALRSMTDPVFAAIDAQQRLRDAQQHVIDVQNDQSSTAADVAEAQQEVTKAAVDNQAAMYDLAAAMEAGDTSLEAVLATLKAQVKQGAITRGDYNATALVAAAAFGRVKSSVEAVPGSRTTTINARDNASRVADAVRATLDAGPGPGPPVALWPVAGSTRSLSRAGPSCCGWAAGPT
jgi:hypothetical protein